jgi:hypothetical protein
VSLHKCEGPGCEKRPSHGVRAGYCRCKKSTTEYETTQKMASITNWAVQSRASQKYGITQKMASIEAWVATGRTL